MLNREIKEYNCSIQERPSLATETVDHKVGLVLSSATRHEQEAEHNLNIEECLGKSNQLTAGLYSRHCLSGWP